MGYREFALRTYEFLSALEGTEMNADVAMMMLDMGLYLDEAFLALEILDPDEELEKLKAE